MLKRLWSKPPPPAALLSEEGLKAPVPASVPGWVEEEAGKYPITTTQVFTFSHSLEGLFRPYFGAGRVVRLDGHALSEEALWRETGVLGAWVALADLEAQKHGAGFVTRWSRLGGMVDLFPQSWEHGWVDVPALLCELVAPLLEQEEIELAGVFMPVVEAAGLGKLRGLDPCVLLWTHPPMKKESKGSGWLEEVDDFSSPISILGLKEAAPRPAPAAYAIPPVSSRLPSRLDGVRRDIVRQEGTPPLRENDVLLYNHVMAGLEGGLVCRPWPSPEVWRSLRSEFPWALEACGAIEILAELAHFVHQPFFRLPPLLLVGPPGCGKTRLAQRIAKLAGVPRLAMSGAGKNNGQALLGSERAWSSAQPSSLLQFMVKEQVANPVVVIDELDKAAQETKNGDLPSALLPFLEPESARGMNDDFLMAELDFSGLSWIATANDTSALSGPLLSRFKVIELGRPRAEHLPVLCEGIREDLAQAFEVPASNLPALSEADLARLKKKLGMSFSAREVRLAYENMLAERARQSRLGLMSREPSL